MLTINGKKKRFTGNVTVRGVEVYVDTKNGEGFKEIFELMASNIYILARYGLTICPWSTIDDLKQEISIMIIEGVLKYDKCRGASLSTFLNTLIKNRLVDLSRKKDPLKTRCDPVNNEKISYEQVSPSDKIDILKYISCWDEKWRTILFRVIINEEMISTVAEDFNITPWGLTRAIRRKLKEAKELR
jgi:DNA-directed RNA polymerase specialized sigma24 family protein